MCGWVGWASRAARELHRCDSPDSRNGVHHKNPSGCWLPFNPDCQGSFLNGRNQPGNAWDNLAEAAIRNLNRRY